MPRKDMERKARQQFVVDTAMALFARQGVEKTSMDDIAAAVDYTRRTLYAYFSSRDEIFLLALIEDLKTRWAKQKEDIATVDSGLDKILAWGLSLFAYSREHPHSIKLQLYWDFKGIESDRVNPEIFAAFEAINSDLAEGLREIFDLGTKDGSLRPGLQVDMSISQFLYSLRAVLHRALTPTYSFANFEPDEYVEHYLNLFIRGIRNSGVLDEHS